MKLFLRAATDLIMSGVFYKTFTLVILFSIGVSTATAANWYVDAALGNDMNSCTAPGVGNACQSIQAAINKASSGDTIHVVAGSYVGAASGPLTINKTLTLLGAQAAIDARGRIATESIVRDSQGTYVSADNVTIDGFTFQDSTNNAFTGYGIWMGGRSGTQILNNIIQTNIVGIGLSNPPGGNQVVIKHNLIQNNNYPGSASGTGIYTDQYVSGGKIRNVLIEENTFQGNNNAGIDISNTDSENGVYDVEVSRNLFDANGRGLVLFNTHDSSIHDNTITNSTLAMSAAIRIFDSNSNLSIMHNNLMTGDGRGFRVSNLGIVGPNNTASSNVVINYNNIEVFADEGLLVEPNGHVGTLNAKCNWWNSSTGPMNPNNPGGLGEEVVGDADFTPWLIARAPGGDCIGGIPSTPGKVTGGGQVGSDPVFSTTGTLLSLPALIPSLVNPQAMATFGFVVNCCAPSGNLEYNDHQADVRIKAQSISALIISNGTCGPNTHAKFTGTASVTRSTGTTTETFTVDVDDCGEPGTADKFGIKTTTYSNGPSVLIGGNIQIHKSQ